MFWSMFWSRKILFRLVIWYRAVRFQPFKTQESEHISNHMASPSLFSASSERESLIAAWQALGNSQPLCEEAQTLCLNFMRMNGFNGPPQDSTIDQAGQQELIAARANAYSNDVIPLLPPQRYVRQTHRGKRAPPMGPSEPTEVTDVVKPSNNGWSNVAPDGPTDGHQNAIRERLDELSLARRA